jgi:hypothetical protein
MDSHTTQSCVPLTQDKVLPSQGTPLTKLKHPSSLYPPPNLQSAMKRIAIVGGTGLLGQAVVQALHAHPNLFTLTIISRSPPSHPPLPGVSYRSLDSYTAEPDSPFVLALRGHDVLVSTVGGPVAPTGVPPVFSSNSISFHQLRRRISILTPSAKQSIASSSPPRSPLKSPTSSPQNTPSISRTPPPFVSAPKT